MNENLNLDNNCNDIVPVLQGKPIFLVGMMGAGKTTLGKTLARKLAWEFVDLDHELEARCGVPVATIFEIEGEQGFRKRESMLVDEYTQRNNIVIATGGGAILDPTNRENLKQRGIVIYLRADAKELFRRVEFDRKRPLLQTSNPRQSLENLLNQRDPLYSETAHLIFDTENLPITNTTRNLIKNLHDYINSNA